MLYSFGTNGNGDGWWPNSGVIRGPDGTLYGTAQFPGGTLYKIKPPGQEVVLHRFTPAEGTGPAAEPALDSSGNLYASVCCGGQGGYGAIFKLAPDGTFTDLHDFTDGSDGGTPLGETVDSQGNIFGVADKGGANNDGVLYEITSQGQFQVLHTFSGGAGDGDFPTGTPMVDDKGNVYGTTQLGGGDCGTIFKVTPKGEERILLSFRVTDGCQPYAGVVRDNDGNLYVTTYKGGAYSYGSLVKLSPSGRVTVLHSFGETGDGYAAYSPPTLVENKKGNVEIYGLTAFGGDADAGTAYEYSGNGQYEIIYSFTGGKSAATPLGLLAAGSDGRFYGASTYGGAITCEGGLGCGTVFEIRTH